MSIRRTWQSLRGRLGYRGDFLLFLGLVDLVQAVSMLGGTATGASYAWFAQVAPLPAWAVLWGGTGLVCLYHAFRRDDHFAFVAAFGMKLVWGIGSFAAWIFAEVTPLGAVLWLVFGALVWRVASWPEPVDLGEDVKP